MRIFSSIPFLFRFRFGHRLFFILSFPFGYYAVSSVSVSASTRLAYDIYACSLIRTYADLTFYFCMRYTICFSYCVVHLLFLFVFLPRQFSGPEFLEPVL